METILIILGALLLVGALVAGFLITKEALNRQTRIMQMKRFRNSVRPDKAALTAEDKSTMI